MTEDQRLQSSPATHKRAFKFLNPGDGTPDMANRSPAPTLPAGLTWTNGKGTLHLRWHGRIVGRAERRGVVWWITANLHASDAPANWVTCIAPSRLRAQRWLLAWAQRHLCLKRQPEAVTGQDSNQRAA